MKHKLSLALALLMVFTSIPAAFATEAVPCVNSETCEGILAVCETCGKENVYCDKCERCYECEPVEDAEPVEIDPKAMVDYTEKTAVTAVGPYEDSYYTVTVPAHLAPGETRQIHVEGYWMENQILKVTVDDELILTKGNKTLALDVYFEDIAQRGSETETFDIYRDISIENVQVLFGSWSGDICYDVEFITE